MSGRPRFLCCAVFAAAVAMGTMRANVARAADNDDAKISFNRDVRPILSDTCFKCHGFDANKRKADLRLDTRAGALHDLGGGLGAIVPGKPEESEAFRRLSSDDIEEKMPPPDSGLTLTKEQVETIRKWIEQGAVYQAHWSLIPPSEVAPPSIKPATWARNPIDKFVVARLEEEGLEPSKEADKVTLIRRVTLDLTGLPPTPAEVDAFLADQSADAYEKLADRLLASPRFGEQMALRWLDLARFADTNGYQNDTERAQWRYRDWVIESFNRNEPFDQFTIDQLAGDLIPNATLDQKIASGFNRNHRITLEGGVIPEEYRVEYVTDRVETTATTWLGLTMGCARCHDHKYDPITQKEFYSFFAFFNHVPENGIDGRDYNSVPKIPAPIGTAAQKQLADLEANVATTAARLKDMEPAIAAAQEKWAHAIELTPTTQPIGDGLVNHYPLDGDLMDAVAACRSGDVRDGEAKFVGGLVRQAMDFDGKRVVDLGDVGRFEKNDAFSIGAWVFPTDESDAAVVARMDQRRRERGYNLYWQRGLVHFQLMNAVPDNMITLVSAAPVPANRWHHVLATYDGSGKAAGAKVYLDGKPLAMTVTKDALTRTIVANVPMQIGARYGHQKFVGRIDDVRVYNRALAADEVAELGGERVLIRHVRPESRTPDQVAAIRQHFVATDAPQEAKKAVAASTGAVAERDKVLAVTPTVMVMSDAAPRDTFVLKRGQYDQPGEKVAAGVPSSLPPLPTDAKADRLALAKWLVQPNHPLTARVTVNRFWESYFGTGIVKSSEDFGMQSEYPTHPELLDWLAVEFVKSGWDVKAMQKLIVTSATYRQASRVSPALLEKDPANRLLARGPRLRLSAEAIRDQAMFAGGLLVEKLGGPSVRPYQPPKIWEELTTGDLPGLNGQSYKQDTGEALYRRSMYCFWKRTVPLPTLTVFDAPAREVCTVRRSRTNTPLQALALLNDTIFVESARRMAERVMTEGGPKPADRLTLAFRLAVARKPTPAELKVLVDGFNAHLATYFSEPEAATKAIVVGESKPDAKFDARELAAYTAQCGVILNLDQTITRE